MQTLPSTLAGPLRCVPLPSIAKQYTSGEEIMVCTVHVNWLCIAQSPGKCALCFLMALSNSCCQTQACEVPSSMAEPDSHMVNSPVNSNACVLGSSVLVSPTCSLMGCCVVGMQGRAYRLPQHVCCVPSRVPLSSAPHAPASATSYAHNGLERHTSKVGLCMVYTTFQRYAYLADALLAAPLMSLTCSQ